MRLTLPNELELYIQKQVSLGNFPSPEAVVEDALRQMMVGEGATLTDEDIAAIKTSDKEFSRGEGIPAEEVKTRIRRRYGKA